MSGRASGRLHETMVIVGRLNSFFELFVKVALIVGGIAAVGQYFDVQKDKRVERTLAYAARFQADPLLSSQQTLTMIFRSQHRTASNLSRAGIDPAGALQEEKDFVEYLRADANGTGVEREIDTIVSFMDDVSNCLHQRLCDPQVTRNYFGPFADQFDKNLKFYIDDIRASGSPQYAEGLHDLALIQRRGTR